MNTLWKILRAEIDYNKIFLFGFHLFSAVCFIVIWVGVKFEHNRVPLFMMIILISTFMTTYIKEKRPVHEKKYIRLTVLPVSLVTLGIERLLFPLLYLTGQVVLFYILFMISSVYSESTLTQPLAAHFVYLGALVLMVNALYFIYLDMKKISANRMITTLNFCVWIAAYFVAFLQIYITTNFLGLFVENGSPNEFFVQISGSWKYISILGVIGIILSLLSLYLFQKRKSFI